MVLNPKSNRVKTVRPPFLHLCYLTWSPEKAVLASFSESFVDNFIGIFSVAFCGMSAVDRFNVADWLDKLSMVPELLWMVEEERLCAVLGADPVEVLWALDIFNILHAGTILTPYHKDVTYFTYDARFTCIGISQ